MNAPLRMLILADDLTGAADCAVACAGHGLRTVVALDDFRGGDADVLAIDADTRAADPGEAAVAMARLVREHGHDDAVLIYKKIDSTLRGNVAVEIAAALKARRAICGEGKRVTVVLAPAFPASGRTTLHGRQMLRGVPLEATDAWRYERAKPPANIAELFNETGLKAVLMPLEQIRADDLRETMRAMARQADVLVCDAETDEDLRAIADASMVLGWETIWAGSAGLAYQLPKAAGLARPPVAAPEPALGGRPMLFVVGSGSDVSRRQAQVLESWPDVVSVRVAPGVLRAGDRMPEWRSHQAALERAFSAGVDVLLMMGADGGTDRGQDPALAAALGEMVRPFADVVGAGVATGGATARAVLRGWGIPGLQILGEVEAGVPYSMAAGWRRPLPVLTKAGGFGKPEALVHCRQFLRGVRGPARGGTE